MAGNDTTATLKKIRSVLGMMRQTTSQVHYVRLQCDLQMQIVDLDKALSNGADLPEDWAVNR